MASSISGRVPENEKPIEMILTVTSGTEGIVREIRTKGFVNVFLIYPVSIEGIVNVIDPLYLITPVRYVLIDRDSRVILLTGNSYSTIMLKLADFLEKMNQDSLYDYLHTVRE
jgi:hypothetical protein